MEINKQTEEILRESWEVWRKSPVTNQLVKVLANHRESFVTKLSANATNLELDPQHFKNLAVGLRNMDTVISMITDFEVFKQQLEKK